MNKATVFRVVRLSDSLRDGLKRVREEKGQTNEGFIADSVTKNLSQVVESLQNLGFSKGQEPRRPVRLPFSKDAGTLKALHHASQSTGIPAIQLLSACLSFTTKNEQIKNSKKRVQKSTSKSRKSKAS